MGIWRVECQSVTVSPNFHEQAGQKDLDVFESASSFCNVEV